MPQACSAQQTPLCAMVLAATIPTTTPTTLPSAPRLREVPEHLSTSAPSLPKTPMLHATTAAIMTATAKPTATTRIATISAIHQKTPTQHATIPSITMATARPTALIPIAAASASNPKTPKPNAKGDFDIKKISFSGKVKRTKDIYISGLIDDIECADNCNLDEITIASSSVRLKYNSYTGYSDSGFIRKSSGGQLNITNTSLNIDIDISDRNNPTTYYSCGVICNASNVHISNLKSTIRLKSS